MGQDYIPNHDIVLIKVTPTGSLEWSKIIDTGKDDTANMIIPTNDGGAVIPAHLTNRWSLIRFSKDGSIVWDKDLVESGCFEVLLPSCETGIS